VAQNAREKLGKNGDQVEAHGPQENPPGPLSRKCARAPGIGVVAASHCVMRCGARIAVRALATAYAVAIIRRAGFCWISGILIQRCKLNAEPEGDSDAGRLQTLRKCGW
jgi:hypothetical protein